MIVFWNKFLSFLFSFRYPIWFGNFTHNWTSSGASLHVDGNTVRLPRGPVFDLSYKVDTLSGFNGLPTNLVATHRSKTHALLSMYSLVPAHLFGNLSVMATVPVTLVVNSNFSTCTSGMEGTGSGNGTARCL